MTQMELNERIITEIQNSRNNKGVAIATALSKVLHIGKESIYRRLRGEVAFTLEETILLSKSFNFSMDKILGYNAENVYFQLDLDEPYLDIEQYSERLAMFISLFDKMALFPNSEARYALNCI